MNLVLETDRLILRPWRKEDREAFAALNADPEVMQDLGGPMTRRASDAKLDRYRASFEQYGFSRWAIEEKDGPFVGYAGVMQAAYDHPLAPHEQIGWRLVRSAWGKGYATEAARAALDDVFTRVGLDEVLAYTSIDNLRSQAVMARLGLRRDPMLDFDVLNDDVPWHGLVWVAEMRQPVTQV
ncbi:MAG TPA: GNAT family N-acetyltransferase [Reyranella sp.]